MVKEPIVNLVSPGRKSLSMGDMPKFIPLTMTSTGGVVTTLRPASGRRDLRYWRVHRPIQNAPIMSKAVAKIWRLVTWVFYN